MVKDAMTNQKLIGMALLRGDWEKSYHGSPDIFPVGCVGEVVSATPLPDGRYNIVLYGLREYKIQQHILDVTPYRQAEVFLRDEPKGSEQIISRPLKEEILDLVKRTVEREDSDLLKILSDLTLDGETWLNICCYSLDASTLEKQSLLEASSMEERAKFLLNLLHFKIVEKGSPFEGLRESKDRKPPH